MDSAQVMSIRKQKTFLTPQNAPDRGVYSGSSFSQISFTVAKVPGAYIDPRTLRLQGKLRIVDSGNADALPINVPNAAASRSNGVGTSQNVSVHGFINEVHLSTLNNRSLETVRDYNRYVATTRPFHSSSEDVTNGGCLYDAGYQTKSVSNALVVNQETDFAIQLRTGLLHNDIIPISEKGLHGMTITLNLAQNSILQPYFKYSPTNPQGVPIDATTPAGGGVAGSFRYELFDLALTFDMLILSQGLIAKIPSSGTLQFNTVSTLTSTLLSSDQSINLRFGTKHTLSTTHSMIPSIHVNNIQVDSLRLCEPENGATAVAKGVRAPVTEVQYMRNGRLFPYDYFLNSEQQALDQRPTAMILEPAQNSVTLYDTEDSMLSCNTVVGLTNARINMTENIASPYTTLPDPLTLFILGVPFDSQKTGVSFQSEMYNVRIQSSLDQRSPQTFYTFTTARNIVAYNATGIQVLD